MKPIMLLLLPLVFVGCNRKTSVPVGDSVQKELVISEQQYQATVTNNYHISNATIAGDSLFVTFGASGCSGGSWETSIVDADRVAESHPVQRYLKLRLINNELCAAAFSRKIAVNIRPLRVTGTSKVAFNLNGWNQPLLYQY
ncbi:hypothetical protein LL912_19260 [Niabella sp. CC-SYL272]|uniref:hypothetical protein n=1 Tax=Niabella agricola TaxID=2891571 RepID=UPI001F2BA406|nr:hypothetical protein [Niabella agricola]MCF3110933.1 hypothetical protein [Niabella agricola]